MPIQVVLFDLDDTVVNSRYARYKAIVHTAASLQRFGISAEEVRAHIEGHLAEHYTAVATGALDLATYREKRFLGLAGRHPKVPASAWEDANALYESSFYGAIRPLDGAKETLEALQPRYHIGILTNGNREMQERKLKEAGMALPMVASSDVQCCKWELLFFRRALERLGVEPGSAAYFSDSYEKDVVVARTLLLAAHVENERHEHDGPCLLGIGEVPAFLAGR